VIFVKYTDLLGIWTVWDLCSKVAELKVDFYAGLG
jgi:hypothetical protein